MEILFGPDMWLGAYVERVTGRRMHVWDGECHVHAGIRPRDIERTRAEHPGADFLIHPECGCSTSVMEYVAAGGGRNHRLGLYDAVLIKENHIALSGGLVEAVRSAREAEPEREVEVECRSAEQVEVALGAGADRLLLDNMTPALLREIVARVDGRAELEASGGVTLETIRDIAASGVQFVSVGALTHSAPALDLSLLLEPSP